jgi:O-antigen/teichoic acid export membrane protein
VSGAERTRRRVAAMIEARRGAGLWLGNAGVMAVGFLVPLALARLAAPEDFGRFSFVTAVVAVCSILTAPGLGVAVTQGAARGHDGVLGAALASRVRLSGLAVAAIAVAGIWVMFQRDDMTGLLLLCVAPLVVPAYACDLASAFLNGQRRYREMVVVLVVAAALPAAAVVAALLAGGTILVVTLAYFGTLALVNVASYMVVRRRYVTTDEVDPSLIRYGRRLSWISSLGAVQYYFDRLVIGLALGFDELAIYSTAKIFQQGLKSIWTTVNQRLFAELAACDLPAARRLVRRTQLPISLGFLAAGLIVAALVPVLVPVVFGDAYAAAIGPAQILALAVVVGVPGAHLEMLFRATSDERRLFAQRIVFTVAEIACTGAGAWWYGVTGAAVGMVVAYGLNTVAGFVLDRRR